MLPAELFCPHETHDGETKADRWKDKERLVEGLVRIESGEETT